jgi:hypothetical protein
MDGSVRGFCPKRIVSASGKSGLLRARIGFHRHVLDYFWTAVTPGRAKSHAEDGTIVEAVYSVGETRHLVYGKSEYKIHDLENVGDTDLWFTTVEFLDSVNAPLELGREHCRERSSERGVTPAAELFLSGNDGF